MLLLKAGKRHWSQGVSFVRSKFHLPSWRTKSGLGLIGAFSLVAVPTAAFAVHSISSVDSNTANTTSQSSAATPAPEENTIKSESTAEQNSSSDGSASNQSSATTQITVNGETIPVPKNGEVHKEIVTENGQTTVDASNQSTSNSYTNTTNIQMNTQSSSSTSTVIHNRFSSP